jgi:hypothetical protein
VTNGKMAQTSHSTRVLQILPGLEGTEIRYRIHNYAIKHDRAFGPYEASSYAWDDPTGASVFCMFS